ncbi:hypothetical protein KRP22_000935 [Phytophthora ramorum]|nr:hypothetical protein KRP22_328 [Phytophthora ramorum]
MATVVAINDQDCAVNGAARSMKEVTVTDPEPPQKEREIDEVMEFLKFSVKPSTSFGGTILFKFRDEDGAEPKTTYAVEISDDRQVATRKNASASDVRPTCEVTISMDDFLWIYSGKASSSDLVKLFYAGRVAISGYAFRSVSKFAQSFDFSSDKWRSFYAWQAQKNDIGRSSSVLEEARNVGSPSRDYWFFHARSILDRYKLNRLQRLLWETSLAIRDHKLASGKFSVIASVVGNAGPVSALLKRRATGEIPPGQLQSERELRAVLVRYLRPCTKQSAVIEESLSVGNPKQAASSIFQFFDEDFVVAVKLSTKERQQRRHRRNRVDLGDAGMAQLDKLVKVIGKGGHSNLKRDNRSKYVPAPELLLREFRVNIPAPEMDWLVRNGRSGNMVIPDYSSHDKSASKCAVPSPAASALPRLPQNIIVEVNRAKIARSGKRFDVPKQRIKAKFASISRELATQRNPVVSHIDEHLVFSDYL